ncbi:MAG: hypothetical protein LBQ51_07415 [Desulfovibrio sp.]|nr:hypothetical protein [Desulfovibrio sp.]
MFSDPVAATMVMQILFFIGMVVMFFFLARAMSAQGEETREALRKQQMYLADLERQLMDMSFLLRRMQGGEENIPAADPGRLHELPLTGQRDALLSMPARKSGITAAASDGLLLQPPLVSRPSVENYDPENDPYLFEDDGLAPGMSREGGTRDGLREAEAHIPSARRNARR